jgi:hypothetical protein
MTVPFTFANQTGNIPLAELDANFAALDVQANVAITVSGNSQPNITDVGTLTYLSSSGNITADYFVGNGAALTGIVAVSTYGNSNVAAYLPVDPTIFGINSNVARTNSNVANTNSNVARTNSNVSNTNSNVSNTNSNVASTNSNVANLTIRLANTNSNVANLAANITTLQGQVYANANVANYLPIYSGNVSANYFIGNGSLLTNLPAGDYSNANVAAYLPIYTGNIGSGNIGVTGALIALGNITSSANIVVEPGGFFVGNGNLLSNVNALTLDGASPSITDVTNTIVLRDLSGNVEANFFIGDGSQLSNLPAGNYGNANVASYLPTYTGDITANNISATGNTQSGNILTGGVVSAVGNVRGGNFNTSGIVSVTGNIISGNIYTTGESSAAGNITGGNISTNGTISAYTGTVTGALSVGIAESFDGTLRIYSAGGGLTQAQVALSGVGGNGTIYASGNITGGNISTVGNVIGYQFFGDGSQLTNLPAGNYSNSNVQSYLGNLTSNVSTTGNIISAYLYGDGSNISNLPAGNYGNANVEAYLPTSNTIIAINSNVANTDGNVANLTNALANTNSNVANIASNVTTLQGQVYSNTNVASYLTTYTGNVSSNNISITGTANLGNLTITDQTIAGTVTDRDVIIDVAGNANINLAGGLNVHTDGNITSAPSFVVKTDGQVNIFVPTLDANAGAVEIVGTTSNAIVPTGNPGGMLHITGQNNEVSRLYNDGVNNYPLYVGRRYNGTALAPTGVLSGQVISRLGANPYLTDTAAFAPLGTARIDVVATEDQTTTAQGSKIVMNVTPTGSNVQSTVAMFDTSGILLTGNLLPFTDNIYTLGNITNRWIGAYFGNAGIYIQDTTLGTTGSMSLDNGIMLMDGNIDGLQIGSANSIQLTTDGLAVSNSTLDINIGTIGDTGNTHILNAGVKFTDNTVQTTAAIPLVQKGNALGVVPLNASTKIDPIYLPSGAITFKGVWDAANNTPTLADGVGTNGDEYVVSIAGTQNLGSGNITFAVGDFVLYTSANVWVDIPVGTTGVQSFNGRDGIVTLQSGDVTNALSTGSIVNSKLANTGVTINTGVGLAGGGTVELGGTLTLTSTGVATVAAGTGVNVVTVGSTATVSIGQPVGTANSVQFAAITSNTTVQATGNITGGNLVTGGRVVSTGNIVTLANVVTPGSIINSSISTSGNVVGANLITAGFVSATGNINGGNLTVVSNVSAANLNVTGISNLNSNANVKISGGIPGQSLTTDGAGNLSWTSGPAGNIITINGSSSQTANVDFTYNTTTLIYLPTGPVTVNLSNYVAGHTARVIVRYGATPYTLTLGVGNVQQTTEGLLTIPVSGGGGHKINSNQSVQLLYTCFDNTADNCYVASTFL